MPDGIGPGDLFVIELPTAAAAAATDEAAAGHVAEAAADVAAADEAEREAMALVAVKGKYKVVLLGAEGSGKSGLYGSLTAGEQEFIPADYGAFVH